MKRTNLHKHLEKNLDPFVVIPISDIFVLQLIMASQQDATPGASAAASATVSQGESDDIQVLVGVCSWGGGHSYVAKLMQSLGTSSR